MRILYRWLSRLTDPALADAIVGDLEELRRARGRVWRPALAILAHVTAARLRGVARAVAAPGNGTHGLGSDFRHAVRMVRRAPGFVTAAVVVLTLGIGASTAIFSVAYGVSLRPLPYPAPDRLIRLYESNPASGKPLEDVSEPAFHEFRRGAPALQSAALYTDPRMRFLAGATEQPIVTMGVSPAFFDVLGVAPALGASFQPETRLSRSAQHEVVISHGAWQRLFGGDASIVGRTVTFADDDNPWRVIGVMPASFAFEDAVDFWQPFVVREPFGRLPRTWRYDRVVARLRPEASIVQARAELEAVAARLGREFPAQHGGWTVTVLPLHESIVGNFSRIAWLLLATVGVVLAVTYLNVGGLLVARAVRRERETAVRAALGAGAWRLRRLWLAEATVIAGLGTTCGVLFAWLAVTALKAAAPPGIPRLEGIALDLPALSVAVVSSLIAIVAFTLAPGRARRTTVIDGLRTGSAGGGDTRASQLTRIALTFAQCAGAAALVVLAVMLTRSFMKLTTFDLGWQADGVLSLTASPPMPRELRRPWFRYVEWSDRLVARLEAAPGITRAAITTQIPLSPQPYLASVGRGRGRAAGDTNQWPAIRHNVTDGYFDAMQIRLTAGRLFNASDRFAPALVNGPERAERGAVVVSESTARTLWPGQPAIGQALWFPDGVTNTHWVEVIGVVEDIQFLAVGETPSLHVFVPWTQQANGNPRLIVRGSGGPAALIAVVRSVVQEVEPGTRVHSIAPLSTLVARATARPRFTSQLVAGFGLLALALAAVGIYGTLSYLVTARLREIGIRLALGARPREVMATMLWRGFVPALAGGAVGLAIAVAFGTVFRALLFQVEPLDARSVAAGAALLAAVALAASAGPARRASRVDPTTALRSE